MVTVIKNGIVITMDKSRKEKYEKLDIVIENNIIREITKNYKGDYDKLIDAKGKVVMPGLINAHTHLGMSIFKSTNDDLSLEDWLNKKIFPIENNMTDDDIYYTSLLSLIEMIKTGTTCCSDMYFGVKGTMKAVIESNIRIAMSRCITGFEEKEAKERIEEFENLINTYKSNSLVTFTVTPHSMYTCSKNTLKLCLDTAKKYNIPLHMHFCETENEAETIEKSYGESPVNALKDIGYLEHKLLLAHSVHIKKADLKLLKGKDVSVVTNPLSNLNLGCGIADLVSFKNSKINICLGTDGSGSGNNLNMFKHMALALDLQKGKYQDPTVLNSYDALKMATINGAIALGLDEEIGSITAGKKADIIILDLEEINTFPTNDLINQIVHNVETCNIDTVIINGKIIVEEKNLKLNIDIPKLKENIKKICKRLKI